jgi:hypothetical protein
LKKRIAAIRAAQQDDAEDLPAARPAPPVLNVNKIQTQTESKNGENSARDRLADVVRTSKNSTVREELFGKTLYKLIRAIQSAYENALSLPSTRDSNSINHGIGESSSVLSPQETLSGAGPSEHPGVVRSVSLNMGFLPRLARGKSLPFNRSIPLKDLIPTLTPVQKAFFDKLDFELDKVETFYVDREKEMRARSNSSSLVILNNIVYCFCSTF